jgi:hypothetical protein
MSGNILNVNLRCSRQNQAGTSEGARQTGKEAVAIERIEPRMKLRNMRFEATGPRLAQRHRRAIARQGADRCRAPRDGRDYGDG